MLSKKQKLIYDAVDYEPVGTCIVKFTGIDPHVGPLPQRNPICCFCMSSDNRFIVSGLGGGALKVWDVESGSLMHKLYSEYEPPAHCDAPDLAVSSCCISSDNKFIVSASHDCSVKIWDLETGTLLKVLEGHTKIVSYCCLSSSDRFILSTSEDATLKIWDSESGSLLRTLEPVPYCGHSRLRISSDERFIVTAGGPNMRIWDFKSGALLQSLKGDEDCVHFCCLSSDNRFIVAASTDGFDGTLKNWDVESGSILQTLISLKDNEEDEESVISCAISSDNRFVVSGSTDCTLKVWDVESGTLLQTLEGHKGVVYSCSITSDDSHIISESGDGTLKIWDVQSGALLQTLETSRGWGSSPCISSDDRFVVSRDRSDLMILDISDVREKNL